MQLCNNANRGFQISYILKNFILYCRTPISYVSFVVHGSLDTPICMYPYSGSSVCHREISCCIPLPRTGFGGFFEPFYLIVEFSLVLLTHVVSHHFRLAWFVFSPKCLYFFSLPHPIPKYSLPVGVMPEKFVVNHHLSLSSCFICCDVKFLHCPVNVGN